MKQVKIDTLTLDPANVRKHSEKNLSTIRASLQRFGQQKPIVVNKDGVVVAGNGTLTAAIAMGWKSIGVVETTLQGAEATAYAIADNRTAELAEWDDDALAEQLAALQNDESIDHLAAGFTDAEIEKLVDQAHLGGEVVEDEVPEPPADPVTKPGDLWLLGEHRLLCGDCRSDSDADRLIGSAEINVAFTSPPYASQRKYDEESGFKPIPPDGYVEWFEAVQANVKRHLAEDGSWFVNIKPHAEGLSTHLYVIDLVSAHVRKWGWHFATEFCWERAGIPQQVVRRFKNQFEPIYQFALNDWKMRPESVRHESVGVPKAKGKGAGDTNAAKRQGHVSAVEGNEVLPGLAYPGNRLPRFKSEAIGHSAAFPVGLPSFFIAAYSDEGDMIFEPFCGSGSTLIAAEQLGRKCYGIEISPAYCDIIVNRWETLTGGKAKREKG